MKRSSLQSRCEASHVAHGLGMPTISDTARSVRGKSSQCRLLSTITRTLASSNFGDVISRLEWNSCRHFRSLVASMLTRIRVGSRPPFSRFSFRLSVCRSTPSRRAGRPGCPSCSRAPTRCGASRSRSAGTASRQAPPESPRALRATALSSQPPRPRRGRTQVASEIHELADAAAVPHCRRPA